MKKAIISGLLVLIMLTFNSCKKEDYDSKYQPKGTYGNSNISSSTWTVTSWANNGFNYYSDFNVSALTSSVQNSGTVQVFVSIDGGTNWVALPYTVYNTPSNYLWSYITQTGLVEVKWTYDGTTLGSDPNTVYGAVCQFKIVCISVAGLAANPNTDYTNYRAIKRDFNLAD
jgi:hypothetical protein